MELATRYEPQATEAALYQRWLEAGLFASTPDERPAYCVTIPPPNVTGALHLGHALNNSIMDALGRWKRMLGFNVLILPGTDHAGIATQAVVERELKKREGKSRHDLGREAFIARVWDWKNEYGDRIVGQFQKLGCAYDWDRLRFTMDESYVRAIQTVFGQWFAEGHIYLGERMVNWSPPLATAISDIEIDEREVDGFLWHLRYPLADGSGDVVVATTRPETMLGDTAVAVHPDDPRYAALVGKSLILPLTGRTIPLIADDFVKPEFGSGAVKVTPFHDPNDYECGLRNGLPRIEVIGEDARMTEAAGVYAGLDRFEARKRVVAELEAQGFLVKTEPYRHSVPHCDRSGAVIEPRPSHQWFCKMAGTPMVEKALDAARSGRIRFLPERYRETYTRWLENLRDWPISRGLWWGHRLPVWRRADADPKQMASWVFATDAAGASAALGCPESEAVQSEDVLDTWFSSALWPFATLGWPDPQAEAALRYYYPTALLSTAQEILYLWVARMVMTGEHFLGTEPFKDVYIHATILDEHGRRMSKSKGNGIDPVELIALYGADATRFTLLRDAGQRQDIRIKPIVNGRQEQTEQARNFCNKIWNATRFALLNLDGYVPPADAPQPTALIDRWILSRLSATAEAVNAGFESYNMDDAARALYSFFWDDFCDWYIEAAKPRLAAGEGDAMHVLWFTLERALRLLHPILPFLTETLWQALPGAKAQAGVAWLVQAPFPTAASLPSADTDAEARWQIVQEIVGAIRNLQASHQLKKGGDSYLLPSSAAAEEALSQSQATIAFLTRTTPHVGAGPEDSLLQPTRFGEVRLPRGEASPQERAAEEARLRAELAKVEKDLAGLEVRLSDPSFAERAPEAVVTKTRSQHAELSERRAKLTERLG